jgi:hypothetical protein
MKSFSILYLASCTAVLPAQEKPFPMLEGLSVPAGANSAFPFLQTIPDGHVLMSWVEPGATAKHALKIAEFDGTHWTPTRTVVEGDQFFTNWADVPSAVKLRDGRYVAHWLNRSGPATYAYDVKVRVSTDAGAAWLPTMSPHRDGTQTEHGFATVFDSPIAGVGIVWLDGREMTGHASSNHDEHESKGSMTLRSALLTAENEFTPELLIDDRVCECCPTASAVTRNGVVVAYRNRSEDEIRDIYVTRLVDGSWSKPIAVHDDEWNISGCPVNGPALASDGTRVVLAWYTSANAEPRVKVAFSNDEGATFAPPIQVSDGVPLGRVDVELLPDGSALVLWLQWREDGGKLLARRVSSNGILGGVYTVAHVSTDRASGYPRMVRFGEQLFFVWTETQPAKQLKAAVAPIPMSFQ